MRAMASSRSFTFAMASDSRGYRRRVHTVERLGDEALMVLGCELAPDHLAGHVGRQPRGEQVQLLGGGLGRDLDLALGALEPLVGLALGVLLDALLDHHGIAAPFLHDGRGLGTGLGQPRLVLPQTGLGRVAVALGRLQRLADEGLAGLERIEDRPPGKLAQDHQHENEDQQRPERVAEIACEQARPLSTMLCLGRQGRNRQGQHDQCKQGSLDHAGPHPNEAIRPTTMAKSMAPSMNAAVRIMAVLIWPEASGWRAIDSTALPPMRPMPAAPPMTASPAPIAPPSLRAPSVVRK